jgi:isoquinoline 1-oxidoreductase beta subunit
MTSQESDAEHLPDGILQNVSRRGFIAGSTSLVLGVFLFGGTARADSSVAGLTPVKDGTVTPDLFIKINKDETVDLVIHRSEMGQQVWTALAQILVEELEADWNQINIEQAVGHPKYGDQNTDGSRSIRYNFTRFQLIGATVRKMLEAAAAQKWGVKPATCTAKKGVVTHKPSGRKLSFGALAESIRDMPVPKVTTDDLKPREDWNHIAKPVKSLATASIIDGSSVFGQDATLPGMRIAVIAHPPQVLGKPKTIDDSAALEVPGVIKTVQLPDIEAPVKFQPLGGVAVIAENTWAAIKGREALEIEWEAGPNANYDSEAFEKTLMETARKKGQVRRNRGDVDKALAEAATKVEAEYYMPHLAHSCMEPPAAVARWRDDSVEVWGCIQTPQAARSLVASYCEVPEEKVTTHVTKLGGGFGRKSKPDFFGEAAWLAREVGEPVKVVWTREDDLQHSYYHTVSAQRLEGGLDENGTCTAFMHRTVFPPITSTFVEGATSPSWGDMRQGATDTPFDVPNLRVESGEAPAYIRTGWLRSVANIYHAFAVQSFMGELAHAAGRDHKDFLLELIGPPRTVDPNTEGAKYDNYGSPLDKYPIDTGRMAALVEHVAEMADWGRDLPERHGLGIAAHRSFTSYAATVIEVAVDEDGRLTIPGVWSGIDAGTVVNPNHTAQQIEGGTIFGLSNALYGEITAKDGIIEQANFPDWRVMRINESPRAFETAIIPSTAPPGGVGEPPTPPAAPALTNAIFDAVGVRVRRLPVFGNSRRDRLDLARTSQEST